MMDSNNKRIRQMVKNFVMIFVPGLIVVIILTGLFLNLNIENDKQIIKIRQQSIGEMVKTNVYAIFEDIKSDGNIILNSSEIKNYTGNTADSNNQNELKRIFYNMMVNKRVYDSICFVSVDGYEKVRMNNTATGTVAAADKTLQYQGDRYYVAEGMTLNPGEIYISPIDLNTGDEAVETPAKPVIRLIIPVFNDNNERQGILILTYLAQNMLDQIKKDAKMSLTMKVLLLNEDGDYLLSENSNNDFLVMVAGQKMIPLSQEQPEIWQAVQDNGSGYSDDGNELRYYLAIYPLKDYHTRHWVFVGAMPLDVLGVLSNEDNRSILLIATLLIAILAIITAIVSWLLLIKKEASSREKVANSIFKNSKEGIMIMDAEMKVVYVNKAFSTITGYQEEELLGRKPIDLKSSDKRRTIYRNIWKIVNEEGSWQGELVDEKKDGTPYPKYMTISKIFDSKSETLSNYLQVVEDLTKTRIIEETINKIRHYDELTGLPTQMLFETKTREFIKQYDHMAIMVLQVTNFNALYDNLGRKSGNILIKEVSRRTGTFLKDQDLLGIFFKDQFVIARINSYDKLEMGHFIYKMMTYLKEPVDIDKEKVYLNVAIGIAIFPEDSADLEKLIEYANIAKNYALQTGENTYVFYEKEIKENYLNNLKLETELRSSLEKNELSLVFQPQVKVDSSEIIASEALLRWHNERLGAVSPGQFIPVAERTELIIPIGNWVLEEAIKQNQKWQQLSNRQFGVAVNLSPIQFKKSDLPQIIKALLEKYQMPAELLEVEITEGILVENIEAVSSQLEQLKALGVKVAIDDFGTGYSSLKYLQNLNFDKLKIDREFIKDYPEKDTGNIARAILNLASQIDLKVIAEGVETDAQYLFLKEHNCHAIQGYYFYQPLSATEFERLITVRVPFSES